MFKNFLLIIIILLGRNENCYSQDSLIKTRILESICNDSKRTGDTIILPESWTRGLVKKSLNLTKRYDQTNPTQIHA